MDSRPLALFLLLSAMCTCSVGTIVPIGRANYFGYHMFVDVDRGVLQAKLDQMSRENVDASRLYVPPPQCDDDEVCEDVHPLQIQYGIISPIGDDVSASGFGVPYDEFIVNAPFLSSDSNGVVGNITLMLETFTSTEAVTAVYNVAMQHDRTVADKLVVDEVGNQVRIDFEHGALKLLVLGEKPIEPCGKLNDYITKLTAREHFLKNVLSTEAPDFSVCDEELRGVDLEYCRAWEGYGDQIRASGANVCQVWTAYHAQFCGIDFEIEAVSDDFLAHYGMDEEHTEVEGAFVIKGEFDYAISFPCVD